MKQEGKERIAASLAKLMAMMCVRNTWLETLHAGPVSFLESSRRRKKVEMLFAHLKRILGLSRSRLRGPNGAKDEFHLAATAQNLRKLAKLVAARPKVA